jgi:3-oxoacyl-[acyl-carrier-protein] synthase-1
MTSCIGRGLDATLDSIRQQRSGLAPCTFETVDLPTYAGEVPGVDSVLVKRELAEFDCRNNRLAQLGMEQDGFADAVRSAVARYGQDRVGVFMGTSTSGILQTELAYRRLDPVTGALPDNFNYAKTQNTFSIADFTRQYFGLSAPAVTISSACSSSAKVFGSARRMLESGLIDAAIVGGVDSLCLTTLYGFNSLGLLSQQACRPYDRARDGISIGEAAAYALLERVPANMDQDAVLLLGIGESSDAYHMSSPHPEGLGAKLAMEAALKMAGLKPQEIDYINLHGTSTQTNDAAEGKAVRAVFGPAEASPPCSSTKGATGHTLGAAGGIEAVICALALKHGLVPGGVNTHDIDPELEVNYLLQNREQEVSHVLSNSFGFGGTNCSLVFGRAH